MPLPPMKPSIAWSGAGSVVKVRVRWRRGGSLADVTAGDYFTAGCEAGHVTFPKGIPDDRRLLARVLAGAVGLALLDVGLLALGKLDLLPEAVPGLWLVAVASLGAAAAVGYRDAGWLLAWVAAAVVVFPTAWVLALGGPPMLEPSYLDLATIALQLTVPYAVVAGTVAYLVGRGARWVASRTRAT